MAKVLLVIFIGACIMVPLYFLVITALSGMDFQP